MGAVVWCWVWKCWRRSLVSSTILYIKVRNMRKKGVRYGYKGYSLYQLTLFHGKKESWFWDLYWVGLREKRAKRRSIVSTCVCLAILDTRTIAVKYNKVSTFFWNDVIANWVPSKNNIIFSPLLPSLNSDLTWLGTLLGLHVSNPLHFLSIQKRTHFFSRTIFQNIQCNASLPYNHVNVTYMPKYIEKWCLLRDNSL